MLVGAQANAAMLAKPLIGMYGAMYYGAVYGVDELTFAIKCTICQTEQCSIRRFGHTTASSS